MEAKARATVHNGRCHKNGQVFSLKHYDQNRESHRNVNPEMVQFNRVWKALESENIEDCAYQFYEQHFAKALEVQNKKNDSRGQSKRNKTIDDLLRSPRTCPEDTELYAGDRDHAPDPDLLWDAAIEWTNQMHERFPNWHPIGLALHVDEQGAPHVDVIQCWVGLDKNGNEVESQAKALHQMGFERSLKSTGATRYENAKVEFTAQGRKLFQDILISKGIDLETRPRDATRSGQTLLEYQVCKAQERLTEAEAEVAELRGEKAQLVEALAETEANLTDTTSRLDSLTEALATKETLLADAIEEMSATRDKLAAARAEVRDTKGELAELQGEFSDMMFFGYTFLEAWQTGVEGVRDFLENVTGRFRDLASRALEAGWPWRDGRDAERAKAVVDDFFANQLDSACRASERLSNDSNSRGWADYRRDL